MMRSLVLVVAFSAALSGVACAGKEAYWLVMGKDKTLCPTVLKLINEDLKEHGEIRYEDHEMFAAIKWQPLSDVLGEKFADTHCSVDRVAYFDLNNDGHPDTVVKFSGCFKDRLTDSLVFLNVEEKVFRTYDYDDMIKNSVGRFPGEGSPPLATYMVRTPITGKHGEPLSGEGVGGWIVIHPFIHKSVTYLAITDRGVSGTSSSGEGFLVGKYKSANELDEACYFKQTRLIMKKQGR